MNDIKKLVNFLKKCIVEFRRIMLCADIELFIQNKYSRKAVCDIKDNKLTIYMGREIVPLNKKLKKWIYLLEKKYLK